MRICKIPKKLHPECSWTKPPVWMVFLSWPGITSTSSLLICLSHTPAPPPALSWRFSTPLTDLKAADLSIVLSLCFWEGNKGRKCQQTSNSFFQSLIHWFLPLPDGLRESKHTNKPVWTICSVLSFCLPPLVPLVQGSSLPLSIIIVGVGPAEFDGECFVSVSRITRPTPPTHPRPDE